LHIRRAEISNSLHQDLLVYCTFCVSYVHEGIAALHFQKFFRHHKFNVLLFTLVIGSHANLYYDYDILSTKPNYIDNFVLY